MTSFPWPNAVKGRRGNGEIVAAAYAAPVASQDYWKARLQGFNIPFTEETRFGSPAVKFEDPDGLWIEIIFEEGADVQSFLPNSPGPCAYALNRTHHCPVWCSTHVPNTSPGPGPSGAPQAARAPVPSGATFFPTFALPLMTSM